MSYTLLPEKIHQKEKYFYQRLAVAYFDKIIQEGDQKSQELISKMAASADYIGEDGEHDSLSEVSITPMAMYLHAKFQDLKELVKDNDAGLLPLLSFFL
jgi:hypothetical protein